MEKQERLEDAYYVSAMFAMLAFFVLLSFATGALSAPLVWKDAGGNTVRLLDTPCVSTAGSLSTIPGPTRKRMKSAKVNWQGKTFEACWLPFDGGTHLFLIDEAGDQGVVEKKAFAEEPGA